MKKKIDGIGVCLIMIFGTNIKLIGVDGAFGW